MRWRTYVSALPRAHPPDYAWKMSPHSNSKRKENTRKNVPGNKFVLPRWDKCKEDGFTITRPHLPFQYLYFITPKGHILQWPLDHALVQLRNAAFAITRQAKLYISVHLTCANSGFSGIKWHNCSTLGWWLLLLNSALKACPIELLGFHSPIKFWAARESFSCLKNVLFLWNFAF